jgi:CSLREA domain-containing protein
MKRINTAFALVAASLLTACPGTAPVFSVNTTVDSNDVTPGDGICADSAGACSLRAAIEESNAGQGADIRLVGGQTYSLASSRGSLRILKTALISGAYTVDGTASPNTNAVIQPGAGIRIFEVGQNLVSSASAAVATLTAKNLTLRGVRLSTGLGGANAGGAVAIRTGSTFDGENINALDNEAERGAAFLNLGTLRLFGGNLSGNRCNQTQPTRGGAILTGGTLELTGVSLTNNTCDSGAAIYADGGTATIDGATIANNRAYNDGAAITSDNAKVTITASSVVQNNQQVDISRPQAPAAGALNFTAWDRSFYDANYAPNATAGGQVFLACNQCHSRLTDPGSTYTFSLINPRKYSRQALAAKIHADMSTHFPAHCKSDPVTKAQCSMDVAAYLAQNANAPATPEMFGDSPSVLLRDSLVAQNFGANSSEKNCTIDGMQFQGSSNGNLIEELRSSSCTASLPTGNTQVSDFATDSWKFSYVDQSNGNQVAPTCNNQPPPSPGLFASYQPVCWSSFTFSGTPVTAQCTDENGVECSDPRAWQ